MKVEELNEMLGAAARVAILATLADGRSWSFAGLKEETGLADGNLHVQTRKLKSAGMVWSEKVPQGRRQVTSFRLTEAGRTALEEHVRRLRAALLRGEGSQKQTPAGMDPAIGKEDDSRVW